MLKNVLGDGGRREGVRSGSVEGVLKSCRGSVEGMKKNVKGILKSHI